MQDMTTTVTGWVATKPRLVILGETRICSFRLASTPRVRDRVTGDWKDGTTEWFTVRVFRNAARNVAESLHKGDPVVVSGRFRSNQWEGKDGPRFEIQIDATALGHDLNLGSSRFSRVSEYLDADDAGQDDAPAESDDGASADPVGIDAAGYGPLDADGDDPVEADTFDEELSELVVERS